MKSKKINKTKENKKRKKEKIKIVRAVWTLAIIILVLALIFVVFREQIAVEWNRITGNIFEWKGMKWYKKMHGSIAIYSTELAIYRPVENKTFFYTLNLRNDPRKLEEIPADVQDKPQRMVYVSFEAEPLKCTDSIVLAAWRLGDFIDALGVKKAGAFANNITNISDTYKNASHEIKNCSHAEQGTSVILLKESDTDKSYIHQEDYCYVLEIANCETLETSERFVLALIEVMSKQVE